MFPKSNTKYSVVLCQSHSYFTSKIWYVGQWLGFVLRVKIWSLFFQLLGGSTGHWVTKHTLQKEKNKEWQGPKRGFKYIRGTASWKCWKVVRRRREDIQNCPECPSGVSIQLALKKLNDRSRTFSRRAVQYTIVL